MRGGEDVTRDARCVAPASCPSPVSRSPTLDFGLWTLNWLQIVCRSGAIVLLVGFWFDGGLFGLSTAATFWILLELGQWDLTMDSTK